MAIYHLSVKIIGRNAGRSSVAAAAYRSGDILTNQWDGLTHDYSRKNWIKHTEILLPDNALESFKDRSTLWNAVELAEKSSNAQLAREVEIALPKELTLQQQIALTRAYIQENFTSQGMCADFAIHVPPITDSKGIPLDADGNRTQDPNKMIFNNPHAHIMLTMRPLSSDGKWQPKSQKCYLCRKSNEEKSIPAMDMKQAEIDGWRKQYQYRVGKKKIWLTEESAAKKELKRVSKNPKADCALNPIIADWNSKDTLFRWRESWASMCNQALRDNNINQQIDSRSYEAQGINKVASVHLGPSVYRAEKRGVKTDLGSLNREIADDNFFLDQFKKQIEQLEQRETAKLKKLSSKLESLRSQHIAAAYQQILLSIALAEEQDNTQKQFMIADAMAKATEQMLNALKCLEQSRDVKSRELATLNPFQVQKRKELESDIFDVEEQIKAVKKRLSELQTAYKPDKPVSESNTESVEQRRKRIQNLKQIQSQTYKEFYSLVEQNRANMAELRELVRQKRNVYDSHTEQKLKEHYADNFQPGILLKAREQAPDIPNMDGAGIRNNISHRR